MNTRSGRPTDEALAQIAEDQARSMCPRCGDTGTVPAGDLAQWREEMEDQIDFVADSLGEAQLSNLLDHLAAMPQPDMNAELLEHLNTCAGLLGDDYDLLDSKDDSHMAVRVKRVQEALVDARAAIEKAEKGAGGAVSPGLLEAAQELKLVAVLRGDSTLPAPPDDPVDWTARMQTAWDGFFAAVEAAEQGAA